MTLMIKRGRLDRGTAFLALAGPDLKTKEAVAIWLRGELRKLRESKKATLSRVEIADLAVAMLERLADGRDGTGENLLCLLRELLDVDRHRKRITPAPKLIEAARLEGLAIQNREPLGVRELARLVRVRPRAIVDWRRSAVYHKEISMGLGTTPSAIAALFTVLSKK